MFEPYFGAALAAFFGSLLTLCGIALSLTFLATGADGLLPAVEGSKALGDWAGGRLLGIGGVLVYLLGVSLLTRLRRKDERHAGAEGLLLASSGLGVGLAIWLVLAVRATLDQRLIGALLVGLALQSLISIGLTLRLAIKGGAHKLLFIPGVLATLALLLLDLLVLALGAG